MTIFRNFLSKRFDASLSWNIVFMSTFRFLTLQCTKYRDACDVRVIATPGLYAKYTAITYSRNKQKRCQVSFFRCPPVLDSRYMYTVTRPSDLHKSVSSLINETIRVVVLVACFHIICFVVVTPGSLAHERLLKAYH